MKQKMLAVWGFFKCWFGCHEWVEVSCYKVGGIDYAESHHCHTCNRCRMETITRDTRL